MADRKATPLILLAAPDIRLREAMERLLARRGFRVEAAADGVTALAFLGRRSPDLLLLDLALPKLPGRELLRKLRESGRHPGLPVVALGANPPETGALDSLGVTTLLTPPFSPAELLRAVEGALARPEPPPLPLAEHLLQAWKRGFTGRLLLQGETGRHDLVLLEGRPGALRPGFVDPDLAACLERRGVMTAAEAAHYRQKGEDRPELLVAMGCLGYAELLALQLDYLGRELVAGFAEGPFRARAEPWPIPGGLQLMTLHPAQILLQGYRSHFPDAVRDRVLTLVGGRHPAWTPAFWHLIELLPLEAGELELVSRVDGRRSLAELAEEEHAALPLLWCLHRLGATAFRERPGRGTEKPDFPRRKPLGGSSFTASPAQEEAKETFDDLLAEASGDFLPTETGPIPRPPPTTTPVDSDLLLQIHSFHAGLAGRNHYQVFDLDPGSFSFDRLKARYFELTRRFGPELVMRLPGEEAALAGEILDRVATAYNTLSDVVRKERYDELLGSERIGLGQQGDDRFQAQVQYQSGKVFLEMEEWESAEGALQDACNIDQDNGDYLAHLAWAIYRNPKSASSKVLRDKALRLLNRALTLERTAQGHAFKGWMLLEGGQEQLAEAEFNKAVKIELRNPLARRGLRELQDRREERKKGVFRRMFR